MIAPQVRAAGGVVWRKRRPASAPGTPAGVPGPDAFGTPDTYADGAEVAIVHRPRYDDWSLPKGKLDPDEHPLAAACREVLEETGLHPVVGPRLPSTYYDVPGPDGRWVPKVVDYWAMRAVDDVFVPNDEVDGLVWLPVADAADRLTHEHDRDVLAEFGALPWVTGTVLLVRHAKAGDRRRWGGADRDRPLDGSGQAQAVWIARLLTWYGPGRVLSADKARCVASVDPLAAAVGTTVQVDPVFDEESHPDRAVEAIRSLAAAGGVTVVCSQGGIIPAMVSALAGADGVPVGEVTSRKGSLWTLSFRQGRLVAADYLPSLRPD